MANLDIGLGAQGLVAKRPFASQFTKKPFAVTPISIFSSVNEEVQTNLPISNIDARKQRGTNSPPQR